MARVPVPDDYGLHDTFVRDGIAFLCAWNTGVMIYDVGNGVRGGSPAHPVQISIFRPSDNGIGGGPAVHNAWWFHNPVTGEKRYLFLGQEGPLVLGERSSGDIHVLDVSDLSSPREVASLHVPNAGTHNFWMDEAQQVLYAAYYNRGVLAVDVSGTLAGDLSSRYSVAQLSLPSAPFTWGVMLANGVLWASDMLFGLIEIDPVSLRQTGLGAVSDRYTSDLWVSGDYAYTGTWGPPGAERTPGHFGDVVEIWSIGGPGPPTLVDSVKFSASNISDLQATPDGTRLVVTTEYGATDVFDLADPTRPRLIGHQPTGVGIHTGTVAVINGRTYVFAAQDPPTPALLIYDITDLR